MPQRLKQIPRYLALDVGRECAIFMEAGAEARRIRLALAIILVGMFGALRHDNLYGTMTDYAREVIAESKLTPSEAIEFYEQIVRFGSYVVSHVDFPQFYDAEGKFLYVFDRLEGDLLLMRLRD